MGSCFGPADGQELCNKQATHRKGLEGGEKGFPEGSPLRLQLPDPQSFGVEASKKPLINNNFKYLFSAPPPAFKHRGLCFSGGVTSHRLVVASYPTSPKNHSLPQQGGSFQRGKADLSGAEAQRCAHTRIPPPHPGLATLRGRRELRALPSPGDREVPALDLGTRQPCSSLPISTPGAKFAVRKGKEKAVRM